MDTIYIKRGNPYAATLVITDDSVSPAQALDLTGLTVFISVKLLRDDSDDDTDAVISSKITVHSDAENGETTWELTAEETTITPGRYVADLRVYETEAMMINTDIFYIEIVDIKTKRTE